MQSYSQAVKLCNKTVSWGQLRNHIHKNFISSLKNFFKILKNAETNFISEILLLNG